MVTVNEVKLRTKNISDAKDDYRWGRDAELARLDASHILEMPYSQFLSEYSFDLYYPMSSRREFAVESPDGKHIGNCVFYNIDMPRGEAELGIMIGEREYWGKGYGVAAVNALLAHIFATTSINRVHLKTLDWNVRAQRCFENCGFSPVGHIEKNGYRFLHMEIFRNQWQSEWAVKSQEESTSE
jgi:RimJ/RimL family protein N-acetyltransferase